MANSTNQLKTLLLYTDPGLVGDKGVAAFTLEDKFGLTVKESTVDGKDVCTYDGAMFDADSYNLGASLTNGIAAQLVDDCKARDATLTWYDNNSTMKAWNVSTIDGLSMIEDVDSGTIFLITKIDATFQGAEIDQVYASSSTSGILIPLPDNQSELQQVLL